MLAQMLQFLRDRNGATNVLFGLAVIPVSGFAGASVDMSRAITARTELRNALDSAVLAGASHATTGRDDFAVAMFNAQKPSLDGTVGTPAFTTNTDGSYSGSVSATINNTMLKLIGQSTVTVGATSKSRVSVTDTSCILTFGKGLNSGDNSMTFNGSSKLKLTGCTLQSDTSMVCNGSTDFSDKTLAVGVVSKCANANSNSASIPDTFASVAGSITKECGVTSYNGLTWSPTSAPASNKMVTVVKDDRTEYHVCGPLTMSGTGALASLSTTKDNIIVIENGGLTLANNSSVSAGRTAIVFTASATSSHTISFPNGNGQAASINLSPPTTSTNPFAGIALYQDPALTTNVDMSWGPASSITVDGVVYFPNASLNVHGSGYSNTNGCTKILANTFTLNGSFELGQSTAACASLGVTQYKASPRLMY